MRELYHGQSSTGQKQVKPKMAHILRLHLQAIILIFLSIVSIHSLEKHEKMQGITFFGKVRNSGGRLNFCLSLRGSGRGNADTSVALLEPAESEQRADNYRSGVMRDFTDDIGIQEEPSSDAQEYDDLAQKEQKEEDDFNDELAGLPYDEWIRRQNERQEAKLKVSNETHEETDFGAGYLADSRVASLGIGWGNYRPLPINFSAEYLRKLHPLTLNRHLWHYCSVGDLETVDALLTAGADPASSNNQSFLPARLHFGLCLKDPARPISESRVEKYGEVHPDESVACVYGWGPLHWAVNGGHAAVARRLLGPPPLCAPGARDWRNLTAAHVAAALGRADLLATLLDAGADPNATDSTGNAPLHYACWEGRLETARLLLARGAAADPPNAGDETPLHWAARRNRADLAALLLDHGADPTAETRHAYSTPLRIAEDLVARARANLGCDTRARAHARAHTHTHSHTHTPCHH
jgi:ankyrin repeat protein